MSHRACQRTVGVFFFYFMGGVSLIRSRIFMEKGEKIALLFKRKRLQSLTLVS